MGNKSRQVRVTLEQLGAAVTASGIELKPARPAALPDLGSIVVEEVPNLEAIAADKAQLREWLHGSGNGGTSALDVIKRLGEAIGPALGLDRDSYDALAERVIKNLNTALQIMSAGAVEAKPGVRDQLRSAFAQAILAKVVHTNQALARFAEIAFGSLRLLVPAPAGADDTNTVTLPLTPEGGGRWEWTPLAVAHGHRDAHRIIMIIQAAVKEARENKREVYQGQIANLREGTTGNFLEVLATGAGTATFYSPTRRIKVRGEDRTYLGGNVKVRVENGRIYPIEAVGGCARKIGDIVVAGISIPTDSVKTERYDGKFPDREKIGLVLAFHGLCRAGYLNELELQPGRDEFAAIRAKQTIHPAELVFGNVVVGTASTAVFFFKRRRDHTGHDAPAWRDAVTGKEYSRVTFAVTRREDGAMAVTACLKENDELFAGCREFTQPGERFEGLPSPIREMLRKLYAVFSAAQRRQQQAQAPANGDANGASDIETQFLAAAGEASPVPTGTGTSSIEARA